jgi:hypothetical protein
MCVCLQAYLGAAWMIMIVFCYGYTSFAPFSVSDFFIFYTLLLVGKSNSTFLFLAQYTSSSLVLQQIPQQY